MSAAPSTPMLSGPVVRTRPIAVVRPADAGHGVSIYVVLMMLLVPFLNPAAPGQITMVDALNVIALIAFTCAIFANRRRVEFPLIGPVLLAAVGSMIAVTNAESVSKAMITMLQDAYLYLWFVMLVALLKTRGDMKTARIAWMWAANIAGAIAMVMLLTDGRTTFAAIFGARGQRAWGLFDGPNSLADYMMMSLFVVITLNGQVNRVVVWGSFAFQLLVLIASKSNGAMLSWMLGMALWAMVRMSTRTRSLGAILGGILLVLAATVVGVWMVAAQGEAHVFREIQKKSFLGRFEQSAEGRGHIWTRLQKTYARAPLGIAPGNSSEQRLSVGERERKHSYRSKEAHSDYLGYLVERGPLALIALLLIVALPFRAAWIGYRKNPPAWKVGTGGALMAAFMGGLLATALHSFFMEKLHFRHYWVFMALIYAVAAAPPLVHAVRRSGRPGESGSTSASA